MDIDNALDTPRDAAHTTPTAPTAPTVPIAGSGAEMDVESGENETIQVRSVEVPRWLSTPGKFSSARRRVLVLVLHVFLLLQRALYKLYMLEVVGEF